MSRWVASSCLLFACAGGGQAGVSTGGRAQWRAPDASLVPLCFDAGSIEGATVDEAATADAMPSDRPAISILQAIGTFYVVAEPAGTAQCFEVHVDPERREANGLARVQRAVDAGPPIEGEWRIRTFAHEEQGRTWYRIVDDHTVHLSGTLVPLRPQRTPEGALRLGMACSSESVLGGTANAPLLDGAPLFWDIASCVAAIGVAMPLPIDRPYPRSDRIGEWCLGDVIRALEPRLSAPSERKSP